MNKENNLTAIVFIGSGISYGLYNLNSKSEIKLLSEEIVEAIKNNKRITIVPENELDRWLSPGFSINSVRDSG